VASSRLQLPQESTNMDIQREKNDKIS